MIKYILLLLLTVNIGYGQVLKGKTIFQDRNIKFADNNIGDVFEYNDTIIVSLLKEETPNEKNYSIDRRFSIYNNSNSTEYNLKQNEYPLDLVHSKLYTLTEDIKNDIRKYRVYNYDSNGLEEESSIELSLSSSCQVLKNGNVILTEGGHSGRDWIGIYSNKLIKIHQFKAFNGEFTASYSANENFIAFATQMESNAQIRVAIYGAFDNHGFVGSQQVDIDENLIISSVSVVDTYVVILLSSIVSSETQLLILDKGLDVSHKINLKERVSHNKILAIKNNFYVNTPSEIMSYNVENGSLNWIMEKEKYSYVKSDYGYRFTGSEIFSLDNEYLILLEGIYEDGVDEIKDVFINIIEVDTHKKIQEIAVNEILLSKIKIKQYNNTVIFYSNNKILPYEN